METVVNISKAVSAWSKSKGLSDGQWVFIRYLATCPSRAALFS